MIDISRKEKKERGLEMECKRGERYVDWYIYIDIYIYIYIYND